MEKDALRLFNTNHLKPLTSMNDDELWNFVRAHEARAELVKNFEIQTATGFFYAYPHGIEHFRKCFLQDIEYYREGVIFTLVLDFCFEDEKIELDYWARCGYLDNADSCDTITSDEIMPPIDEDSEEAFYQEYFHLLEPHHVENIIQTMEKNFDKLAVNTRKDIAKIKRMKKFCLRNEGYKVAYIYDT